MKIKNLSILITACLLVLISACDNKAPAISVDQLKPVDQAEVWIDQPLDGATVTPPQVAVAAHAYVESGFGEFQFEVVGEPGIIIPKQGAVISYGMMAHYWHPASYGWQTLRVTVFNLGGDPLASAEVDVYVEEQGLSITEIVVEEVPEDTTPDPTPTPEPVNRCDLFDPSATTLTLHDVPLFTTELTYFLTFDHTVPGLEEPVPGDEGEWIFTSIMGDYPSEPCTFRGYTGRIYCMLKEFPKSWWGTNQTLKVFVNGCDQSIFTHDRVSFLKPACEGSMAEDACEWTGGDYECSRINCRCACP